MSNSSTLSLISWMTPFTPRFTFCPMNETVFLTPTTLESNFVFLFNLMSIEEFDFLDGLLLHLGAMISCGYTDRKLLLLS